jgi:hypothetical protein
MKKHISLVALFPLFIFSMDMQGPITHRIEDCLKSVERKYSFEFINKFTCDELSAQTESLLQDADFIKELPSLIKEGQDLNNEFKKIRARRKCVVYGTFCATEIGIATLSGCVAYATNNTDLGAWLCLAGIGMACHQCNTALKRNNHIQNDLLQKILILRRSQLLLQQSRLNALIQQNTQAFALIVEAARQQAGAAHPAQDQYDFSYTEEHP